MAAAQYGSSHKEQLRRAIDRVLPDSRDYEDFLAKMRAEGYEIKEGKGLSFRAPGWDRFTRSDKLGSDYTREALRERSAVRRGRPQARKSPSSGMAGKSICSSTFRRKWRRVRVLATNIGRRYSI